MGREESEAMGLPLRQMNKVRQFLGNAQPMLAVDHQIRGGMVSTFISFKRKLRTYLTP